VLLVADRDGGFETLAGARSSTTESGARSSTTESGARSSTAEGVAIRLPEGEKQTLAALDEQLAQVRLRGYATCRGEYESSAWGVSAPVVDRSGRLVAVLSIWGPGSRVTEERFDVLGPLVHTTAATLLDR